MCQFGGIERKTLFPKRLGDRQIKELNTQNDAALKRFKAVEGE